MKRFLSSLIICISLLCLMMCAVASADTSNAVGITAEYHTEKEVRAVLDEVWDLDYTPRFATKVRLEATYNPGKLTDATQKNAVAFLNAVRFVAGIPGTVSYSKEDAEAAQAGALLNAVTKTLTHYPVAPADMDSSLATLGKAGANHSNLHSTSADYGRNYLKEAILGWIGDSHNVAGYNQGHRRWLLYPEMNATGFGVADKYAGVYVLDGWSSKSSSTVVAWPAQTTPLELMDTNRDAWTVSFGRMLNESEITVSLTRKITGESWEYDSNSGKNMFAVNNNNYGYTGCVIFTPPVVDYRHGETFHVTIKESGEIIADYDVYFFSYLEGNAYNDRYEGKEPEINIPMTFVRISPFLVEVDAEAKTYTGSSVKPIIDIFDGAGKGSLEEGIDYKVSIIQKAINCTDVGIAHITGIGKYVGEMDVEFNVLPKDIAYVTFKSVPEGYYSEKKPPKVTVTYRTKELIEGKDYTVEFKPMGGWDGVGNREVYDIILQGTGNFCGKNHRTVSVVHDTTTPKPKAVKWTATNSISKSSGNVNIDWLNTKSDGYLVQIATNSDFTKGKKSYLTTVSKKTIKGLRSGKYYVRVKAYNTTLNGLKRYGKWSSAKNFTIG